MVSIEKCELFDDDLVSFEEEFHCIVHEKNEAVHTVDMAIVEAALCLLFSAPFNAGYL